jgi:hypothetical protein
MNLSTFISETLVQICEGIEDANARLSGSDAIVCPDRVYPVDNNQQCYGVWKPDQTLNSIVHLVRFDVAVTAAEGSETKGGIGVMVAAIGLGSQGKSESSKASESRIKFDIPVLLPRKMK